MINTALRASAQGTNNTHIYHKALVYILGISRDTREHFDQIYDMKAG